MSAQSTAHAMLIPACATGFVTSTCWCRGDFLPEPLGSENLPLSPVNEVQSIVTNELVLLLRKVKHISVK